MQSNSEEEMAPLPFPEVNNDTHGGWSRAIAIFVIGVLSLMLGYLVGQLIGLTAGSTPSALPLWAAVVAFAASLWVAIFLHEVGHAVGGQISGFRFVMLAAGPVFIYRRGHRLRVGLNRSPVLAGGFAASLPTDTNNLLKRMRVTVAGGPIASALAALLVFAPPIAPSIDLILSATGFVSLGLAVLTLLPLSGGGFASDGLRLLRLSRGGPDTERELAILTLIAVSQAEGRPRDIDEGLIVAALGDKEDTFSAVAASFAYTRSLDMGDPQGARDYLARAIDMWQAIPKTLRHTLAWEATYFEAVWRNDRVSAEKWLAIAGFDGLVDLSVRLRAEAAVATMQAQFPEAQEKVDKALALLAESNTPGFAAAERDKLVALAEQIAQLRSENKDTIESAEIEDEQTP